MGVAFILRRPSPKIPKYVFKDSGGTDRSSDTSYIEFIDDGDENWRIKFKKSGTFVLTSPFYRKIDVFLVGGGGGGSNGPWTKGAGGGYTKTEKNVRLSGKEYAITIGAGGASGNHSGGTSTAFGYSAAGGSGNGNGGSGGGKSADSPGKGGSNGSNGGSGSGSYGAGSGGTGQGTTTREFGESNGTLYGGGGGGSNGGGGAAGGSGGGGHGGGYKNSTGSYVAGSPGTDGLGGGGGAGYGSAGGKGGSGIVIIRNHR